MSMDLYKYIVIRQKKQHCKNAICGGSGDMWFPGANCNWCLVISYEETAQWQFVKGKDYKLLFFT